MQLARRRDIWDPFREFEHLSSRFNRLFGLARAGGDGERETLALTDWAPACNISETETEYRVQAELPSLKKEDVHVTLQDGVLTIRGERREEKEEKSVKFHRRELSYGSFVRRFSMPEDADQAKVDATFKDGMLSVVVGKTKAKPSTAKEIAIH